MSWEAKWILEEKDRGDRPIVKLVGREQEIGKLTRFIANGDAQVAVLYGPSGMGKTRLALETTRAEAPRTLVVEAGNELDGLEIRAMSSGGLPAIIFVDDPGPEVAMRLTRDALATSGVRLILTVPSESQVPDKTLNGNPKILAIGLPPLEPSAAIKLLAEAGAKLDVAARDWVIEQAGGIPDVILSAAQLGADLRPQAQNLKARLAEHNRKRVVKEVGQDAMEILRSLSVLQSVRIEGPKSELNSS